MITEQDFYQAQKAKQQKQRIPYEILLKQAAVDAAKLTGAPEWDKFLTQVQAILEEHQKGVQVYGEACTRAFTELDRTIAQVEYHRHHAAVEVLTQVMSIPQQLVKHAPESGSVSSSH